MNVGQIDSSTPWTFTGQSYTEWAEAATKWLAEAADAFPISKVSFSADFPSSPSLSPSPLFRSLKRLRGYVCRLEKNFSPDLWDKLCALLVKLEHRLPQSLEDALHEIEQLTVKMYDDLQLKSLNSWRAKVKLWHAQSKELYHYLRNPLPHIGWKHDRVCSVISEFQNGQRHFGSSPKYLLGRIQREHSSSQCNQLSLHARHRRRALAVVLPDTFT